VAASGPAFANSPIKIINDMSASAPIPSMSLPAAHSLNPITKLL
jgi:hypothetical protein